MRIAVLGLGYVGCVTAACLARAGNVVVGIDPAPEKVDAINSGMAPIVEPGLSELINAAHTSGRIRASTEIGAAKDVDIAIVCVGTPTKPSGDLDLKFVDSVAVQLGSALKERPSPLTIMLRSTVLPGTTAGSFIPRIESVSGLQEGRDFFVVFCPEFLRESTAVSDFYNPPMTVIGAPSRKSADAPIELLSFLDSPVQIVAPGVAEALKYSCNAFHAVKVAFANEIARVCQSAAVDARDVMRLFVQDQELNISPRYLRPGFAYGGSCLPKDVAALQSFARTQGTSIPLIDSLTESNEAHIERVVAAVLDAGVTSVAQIGLTFKPSTDDLRESPFLKVAAALSAAGVKVTAYDPIINVDRLIGANLNYVRETLPELPSLLVSSISDCLVNAELILLGTNSVDVCDEILDSPPVPVIDLSGMLPPRVEQLLRERSIERTSVPPYVGAAW